MCSLRRIFFFEGSCCVPHPLLSGWTTYAPPGIWVRSPAFPSILLNLADANFVGQCDLAGPNEFPFKVWVMLWVSDFMG